MSSIWFITGASNGLGLTLALRALKHGQKVIASMRSPAKSKSAVDEIESAGGKVFQLDLTESQASIVEKMQAAEKIYGRIDVLVNNAGYSVLGPFEHFTENEVTTLFQTNVFGPFYTAQAVLPAMRARRSGTILNVSSVAGQDAIPTCALYASSKFALEGFTEALWKEAKEFDINVLIVEPGAFRTNFLAAMQVTAKGLQGYEGGVVDETLKKFQAAEGKQPGDPEKAADRMIEVVTGHETAGHLKGRVLRLVLGADAYNRMAQKNQKLQEDIDLCKDITFGTNH